MEISRFLDVLHTAEQLKNNTKHSWTSSNRHESVAEHSWRTAVMAYFVKDEFPEADISRVALMALLHDMGEAFTGDIPAFVRTQADEDREQLQLRKWIDSLPAPYNTELAELFHEIYEGDTPEARIFWALEKMEVLIQHNESDIATWVPKEYTLNLEHGSRQVAFSDYMRRLKAVINRETTRKLMDSGIIGGL